LDEGGAIESNRSVAIIKVSQTENPDYQLRDVGLSKAMLFFRYRGDPVVLQKAQFRDSRKHDRKSFIYSIYMVNV